MTSSFSSSSSVASAHMLRFVLVFGLLTTFGPLSTDMYLASLLLLADSFQTNVGHISMSLSVFFFGLAVGQLLYGPLIDRFGRKPLLLLGVSIFALSSFLVLFVSSANAFIALRFFQAIGSCSGMIIARAMISDLFGERDASRILSLMMLVMGLGPILAPILGGYLIVYAGWHSIFVFLTLYALCGFVIVWRWLPETLAADDRQKTLHLTVIFSTFRGLLRDRVFLLTALVAAFSGGEIFAFISGASYVYMELHHVDKQLFGWLFGVNALGMMVAAQLNHLLLKRFSTAAILAGSVVWNLLFSTVLFFVAPLLSIYGLVGMILLCMASIPVTGANAMALAMSRAKAVRGSASSLLGIVQFGFAGVSSVCVGAFHNGTVDPLSGTILACACLSGAAVVVFYCRRGGVGL